MAALRLEDLLQAQQKLKQEDAKKQTTETMSIEEFKKLANEMGDTAPQTTTKSIIKKGLTDKTGDGLNANVVKLTKVIKDATAKKGNVTGAVAGAADLTPAGRVAQGSQDVEAARRARLEDQAGKYQMGAKGYLKDLFNVKQDVKGMEAFKSGIKNTFQKMFSLEGWFDLDEGKSKGLLGQAVRRKVAQNQYVQKRMESEEGQMLNLPQYQGVEGRAKAQKDLRKQFNRQQDTMAGIIENKKERERVEKVIAEGYDTPAMRKKAAATVEQEGRLDVRAAKDDPAYRRRKKAEEAVPVESTPVAKPTLTRIATDTSTSLKTATAEAEKFSTDEAEEESNRMMGDQTATLKRIEENTSVLKDMASKLAVPVAAAGAAAESGGGLGLGDIANVGKRGLGKLGGAVKRVGGNWLGKVGGIGKVAKGFGIGAIGSLAGEGLQWGGDKLKEAGYEETGKAVNVAGKSAEYAGYGAMIGSVIPGVGTAIGAGVGGLIGAGKGIYDQYFGDKATPVEKAPATREYEVSGVTSDQIVNHPNYQKYYQEALNGRTGPDAERMARKHASMKVTGDIARSQAKQPATAAVPATATSTADSVYKQSGDNVAAAQQTTQAAPSQTIINAPTNVNNTSNFGPKSPPRNTESSLQQYNRSKFAMS